MQEWKTGKKKNESKQMELSDGELTYGWAAKWKKKNETRNSLSGAEITLKILLKIHFD